MKRKQKRILRCGECHHFMVPNSKEKWGWCALDDLQRTRYQAKCQQFIRK